METLYYRKVTQGVENTDFDCGNSTINQYIKNSYFPVLTQQAYAYSVLCKDNTVGYYMVMFREIDIHDFPDEISDYDLFVNILCRNYDTEATRIIFGDQADNDPIYDMHVNNAKNLIYKY